MITKEKALAAQRVLMDNGIDADETAVVMEALGAVISDDDWSGAIEYDATLIPYKESIWEAPENVPNVNLGNFEVDVELQNNGKYDVYLSHEGSSGENHKNVTADDIGRLVADLVETVTDAYQA